MSSFEEILAVMFEPFTCQITSRLDEIERKINRINRKINQLLGMELSEARRDAMTRQELETLLREAQENTDAVASIEKTVQALVEEVRNNVDDPAAVKQVLDTFSSNTDKIAKLALENTPFQPSGQ